MPNPPERGGYMVQGHKLTCPVCGQDRIWTRRTLMNTSAMTFFGFDWADKRADNYVCGRCGYVMWFLTEKTVP